MALRLASQHRIAQRAGVTLEVEQEVPGWSDQRLARTLHLIPSQLPSLSSLVLSYLLPIVT